MDAAVCIWDTAGLKKIAQLKFEPPQRRGDFRRSGKKLDSSGIGYALYTTAQTSSEVAFRTVADTIFSLGSLQHHEVIAFSPNDSMLATVKKSFIRNEEYCGRIILWDTRVWEPIKVFEVEPGCIEDASFSLDSELLVVGTGKGQVKLWSIPAGKLVATLKSNEVPLESESESPSVMAVRVSPDGRLLAALNWDGTLRVWTLE